MSFYIEKAIFVNRAPFDKIELDFKESGINVLSAINGRGKTTVLSHITDAFYELAKQAFHGEFEGKEKKYYRISTSLYNIDASKPSFVYLRFRFNEKVVDYIDVRNQCSEEQYNGVISLEGKIPYANIRNTLKDEQNIKYWSIRDKALIRQLFTTSLLTYFPSYRYELPSYLNDPYSISLNYSIDSQFAGYLNNPIEVITDLSSLVNWFLDVVLDLKLGEQVRYFQRGTTLIPVTVPSDEKTIVWDNLNKIISGAISSKHYPGTVRLGIGPRNAGASRVSVMHDYKDMSETICPSIFNLSSGELALISIFGELLHQADNNQKNIRLEQIQGLVLIDEVDKHLHITIQKEILPRLFNLFPNVQFVVSSHSPFLNMGLAEGALNRTQIIDLDHNGIICEPVNNDLYKEVYEMMVNENQRFANKYSELMHRLKDVNKPVVITEGKTDWKHLKAALSYFHSIGEFKEIEVEILEYNFDFGDSKLHSLLNQYRLFPHKYKVIGVFDCDEANGKNIHNAGGIKKYSENIWGMSIPIPDFRSYNTGISIEFLYANDDLRLIDENGRRMYITSEFDENGRLKEDKKVGVKNNHDVKGYTSRDKEKIQGDEVIDIDGNSLALSKEQFATNILNSNGNFANVKFEAFRSLFDRLFKILSTDE